MQTLCLTHIILPVDVCEIQSCQLIQCSQLRMRAVALVNALFRSHRNQEDIELSRPYLLSLAHIILPFIVGEPRSRYAVQCWQM